MKKHFLIFSFILAFAALPLQSKQIRYFEFGFKVAEPGPGPNFLSVIAATSDPDLIAELLEQLSLPEEERNKHINGKIADGTSYNNQQWSWHFEPDEWALAEMSAELCDGMPIHIEENKTYWLDTVGYFCPWASYVKREIVPSDIDEDTKLSDDLIIYPNPSNGIFKIAGSELKNSTTRIVDLQGRILAEKSTQADIVPFELRLSQGIYFVKISNGTKNYFKKLIIQ